MRAFLLLVAICFASSIASALPILQRGDACGYTCKGCTPIESTCSSGLICLKNVEGCSAGYMGRCQPACAVNGRTKDQCSMAPEYCQYLGARGLPSTIPASCGLGCRVNFNMSTFQPEETCNQISCQSLCDSEVLKNNCQWNTGTSECDPKVNIKSLVTPRCWSSCPNFPAGTPNQECTECKKGLEYEYENSANAYCWDYMDKISIDTQCLKNTAELKCTEDASTNCEWSVPAPTGCPTALRAPKCHEKSYCGYTCKAACMQYPDRCHYSTTLNKCRHNSLTHAPTSPTTRQPSLEATLAPSRRPTGRPTSAPSSRPTTFAPTKPTTSKPTRKPTTLKPTRAPTVKPSKKPTTAKPTKRPTIAPSLKPTTLKPTKPTTQSPTSEPTSKPTTEGPTTRSPTTRPTTGRPTTRGPTTRGPTTRKPTNAPVMG